MSTWAAKYVGLPFDAANENGGLHCWELVRRIFKAERNIDLPAYGEIAALDLVAVARTIKNNIEPWSKVEPGDEREFDVAGMSHWTNVDDRLHRVIAHVGVITSKRCILHVENATATVCVPFDHVSVRAPKYRGAWRFRGVASC
jgi:hypothetical protein